MFVCCGSFKCFHCWTKTRTASSDSHNLDNEAHPPLLAITMFQASEGNLTTFSCDSVLALRLRDIGAYAADLSQAAWRLFRPFLERWNIKRDPAGYTSNAIRVQPTTECHRAAHATQLIRSTLSCRQLLAVCLQSDSAMIEWKYICPEVVEDYQ